MLLELAQVGVVFLQGLIDGRDGTFGALQAPKLAKNHSRKGNDQQRQPGRGKDVATQRLAPPLDEANTLIINSEEDFTNLYLPAPGIVESGVFVSASHCFPQTKYFLAARCLIPKARLPTSRSACANEKARLVARLFLVVATPYPSRRVSTLATLSMRRMMG